jgi:heme/copper-type cytochrome/quinol oxidase subunit 2
MNIIFALILTIITIIIIMGIFVESIEIYYNRKERLTNED